MNCLPAYKRYRRLEFPLKFSLLTTDSLKLHPFNQPERGSGTSVDKQIVSEVLGGSTDSLPAIKHDPLQNRIIVMRKNMIGRVILQHGETGLVEVLTPGTFTGFKKRIY